MTDNVALAKQLKKDVDAFLDTLKAGPDGTRYLFHTMYSSNYFRKSTPPQDRQPIVYSVDGFVVELTFKNHSIDTFYQISSFFFVSPKPSVGWYTCLCACEPYEGRRRLPRHPPRRARRDQVERYREGEGDSATERERHS
jgi:hypothetical protein